MKFSVCIGAVFGGRNFVEGMKAAQNAGIDTFEFWSWWDQDLNAIKKAKDELGMDLSAFCTKFISLTDKSKRQDYIEGLKESIAQARRMGARGLISQVGDELPGIPREEQHASIVQGLKECAPLLEEAGIVLLMEPLNTLVDHKGYYLYSSDEAFRIVEEVGSSNVKVLFDIYHQQIMEGNLIRRITENIDKIGHFHAAGNPGRNELDKGEINYPEIFKAIDAAGFKGCIGLEYFPKEDPVKGLERLLAANGLKG